MVDEWNRKYETDLEEINSKISKLSEKREKDVKRLVQLRVTLYYYFKQTRAEKDRADKIAIEDKAKRSERIKKEREREEERRLGACILIQHTYKRYKVTG